MNILPYGISLPFEVSFDRNDLFVAMKVYDDSDTLISSLAMVSVDSSRMYRANFLPDQGVKYTVRKSVYTDGTYSTEDEEYPQGSESFIASAPVTVTLKKNTQQLYMFAMYDNAGQLATGLTVTAKRSLDGAAIASCANAVAEIGQGLYKITLEAADTDGDMGGFLMTATGAQSLAFTVRFQS